MAMVNGFAGLRLQQKDIFFNPCIPSKWKSYSFKLQIRKRLFEVVVNQERTVLKLIKGDAIAVNIRGESFLLNGTFSCPSQVLKVD